MDPTESTITGPGQRILVLDFGAQYTQLIARRVRECRVYCEILPGNLPAADADSHRPNGIILSGGPSSVYDPGSLKPDPGIFRLGIPVLGICYGHQLMAQMLGGEVCQAERKEFGPAEITLAARSALFDGIGEPGDRLPCWMSHGDLVLTVPAGFEVTSHTPTAPVASMADEFRKLYGVQFHPEVAHTPFGLSLLAAFVHGICGCRADWTPANMVDLVVNNIRRQVGTAGVVCGVSGGVDSCCVAALMHRAIGEQLTCIFVDHGLLRKGEAEEVRRDFAQALGIRLVSVDARDQFLNALGGVEDPEEKRKIIGAEFVRVFDSCAENLTGVKFLAQGTLYPDVIESGGGHAKTIKTHHNVGGLPEQMTLHVVEPLRNMFKDEARAVALDLGLPESIVWRHPFPGPGLAIRILGEVTAERLHMVREADAIFIQELYSTGLYRSLSQALAVLAPIRSVGVMGDIRTYGNPIILRAVTTEDFMTANWAPLQEEVLRRVSARIVNEVPGVNRVVYDITSKPPATIEWE